MAVKSFEPGKYHTSGVWSVLSYKDVTTAKFPFKNKV